MKPEVKALWVEALRSGDYKQGREGLHNKDDNSFCCLGVLCDVAVKQGITTAIDGEDEQWKYYGSPNKRDKGVLPPDVQEWAGLHAGNPACGNWSLAGWNDQEQVDFDRIADLIEENL